MNSRCMFCLQLIAQFIWVLSHHLCVNVGSKVGVDISSRPFPKTTWCIGEQLHSIPDFSTRTSKVALCMTRLVILSWRRIDLKLLTSPLPQCYPIMRQCQRVEVHRRFTHPNWRYQLQGGWKPLLLVGAVPHKVASGQYEHVRSVCHL